MPAWAHCAGAMTAAPRNHRTLPGPGLLRPGTFLWSPKLPVCEHALDLSQSSHALCTNTSLSHSLANHPCQGPPVPTCQRCPMAVRKHRFWSRADTCVNSSCTTYWTDRWLSGSHFTCLRLYFLIYKKTHKIPIVPRY